MFKGRKEKNNDKCTIGITMGDFNGIGPEIILKALKEIAGQKSIKVVIIGSKHVFEFVNSRLNEPIEFVCIKEPINLKDQKKRYFLLDIFKDRKFNINFGEMTEQAGFAAIQCIEKAVDLLLKKKLTALVTAPISKQALFCAGYNYPGQTEMLASLTNNTRFLMILLVNKFRVALVTTHCAISEVAPKLSIKNIKEKIDIFFASLKNDFAIAKPKIAVTALNPHASDGGNFGVEEKNIIIPAIKNCQAKGINATGPLPADTLFARVNQVKYDGYLAMYHDQGLIPLKMSSFGKGVNFTAGLPIIRTSPDHGTAFDIAGKFIADHKSMVEAIRVGYKIAKRRMYC